MLHLHESTVILAQWPSSLAASFGDEQCFVLYQNVVRPTCQFDLDKRDPDAPILLGFRWTGKIELTPESLLNAFTDFCAANIETLDRFLYWDTDGGSVSTFHWEPNPPPERTYHWCPEWFSESIISVSGILRD